MAWTTAYPKELQRELKDIKRLNSALRGRQRRAFDGKSCALRHASFQNDAACLVVSRWDFAGGGLRLETCGLGLGNGFFRGWDSGRGMSHVRFHAAFLCRVPFTRVLRAVRARECVSPCSLAFPTSPSFPHIHALCSHACRRRVRLTRGGGRDAATAVCALDVAGLQDPHPSRAVRSPRMLPRARLGAGSSSHEGMLTHSVQLCHDGWSPDDPC